MPKGLSQSGRIGRRASAGGPRDPLEEAVRYLGRRARSEAEVRRHLAGRGHPPSTIRTVLARLADLGYIDDRALAARYVAWAASERPMGRLRIAADLARRGVPRATIDGALEASHGPGEEAEALTRAIDKALGRSRGVADDPKARRRLTSRLMRRGFRAADVLAALEARVGDETESEGDEE